MQNLNSVTKSALGTMFAANLLFGVGLTVWSTYWLYGWIKPRWVPTDSG